MAIKRLTVSIQEELMEKIKEAAGDESVSGWVSEVLTRHLEEREGERLWADFVAEVMARTTAEEEDRYQELLARDEVWRRHSEAIEAQRRGVA
ncbi:hypothetical protein [Marinactinospora rubrisoli]|uniref:CopG family transcriptional regulator n=1 Tax=Marinactinospora rubrisoli TaxID=2715399 RepID=A0ABW2KCY7_9ACTN